MMSLRLAENYTDCCLENYNPSLISPSVFWTDSTIVLSWLQTPGRNFKEYVANRIGQLQDKTDTKRWLYIRSKYNPADSATRGKTIKELANDKQWFYGPEFLLKEEKEYIT